MITAPGMGVYPQSNLGTSGVYPSFGAAPVYPGY